MYLLYIISGVFGDEYHVEKIGKDGGVEDYYISEGQMFRSTITYVFDNGKILITNGGKYSPELYDPFENKITLLDTIPVASEHAVFIKMQFPS